MHILTCPPSSQWYCQTNSQRKDVRLVIIVAPRRYRIRSKEEKHEKAHHRKRVIDSVDRTRRITQHSSTQYPLDVVAILSNTSITMADAKPISNGTPSVGTRTSTLRKTSINSTASDAPRTGKATVKRGTKRAADGATPVVDEEGIKQSLGFAMDSDDDERDDEGERVLLGKRDKRRLLRVLTAYVKLVAR